MIDVCFVQEEGCSSIAAVLHLEAEPSSQLGSLFGASLLALTHGRYTLNIPG